MCIKHLWPFCTRREKDNDSIRSCEDSSRKRHPTISPDGESGGDSRENSFAPQFAVRSLIEGRWLQTSFKNSEAFYSALSVTNADFEATKALHRDTMLMLFRTMDNKGELWEMEYESLQRGNIKNIMKVGEECDELTPHRQWVRSTMTMPNRNTIACIRKYKNGTQANVIMEVKPTEPDLLIATVYVDDVVTVVTAKRIKS